MRVCALSLFDVDLQTHMNGNSVGAGLVHKLVVMSCLLESLVSWYHLLTVVITGVNEGVENRYFLASVLTANTTDYSDQDHLTWHIETTVYKQTQYTNSSA
jgi:hypothetical protein